MPTLRLSQFRGLAPRFDRRRLAPGAAQVAENVRFDGGDIQPFRAQLYRALFTNILSGAVNADLGNLFFYRDGNTSIPIGWGDAFDVDWMVSPVPSDQHKRAYWNIAGDKMYAISDPLNPAPDAAAPPVGTGPGYKHFRGFPLGIPAPNDRPSLEDATDEQEVGFGTSIAITEISNTNPASVTVDGTPPFENGATVIFEVDDSLPTPPDTTPDGTIPDAGDGPPPADQQAITSQEDTERRVWDFDSNEYIVRNVSEEGFDLIGLDASGYAPFPTSDLGKVTIRRSIRDAEKVSRSYVFTYVSIYGEEGPPSPAADFIDVLEEEGKVRINLGDDGLNEGGTLANVDRIRVYRTLASGNNVDFFLVGTLNFTTNQSTDTDSLVWEQRPNGNSVATGAAWTGVCVDGAGSTEIGERLPSEDWFPPPEGMAGVVMHPQGYMIGFRGNTLFFSETFQPHAWPKAYQKTIEEQIRGIAIAGQTVIIGTDGRPYVGYGADPRSFQRQRSTTHAPLLRKRLMTAAEGGVIYASTDGLVLASGASANPVSLPYYDKRTWSDAISGKTKCVFHDSRFIAYGRGQDALVCDFATGELDFSTLKIDASAAAQDVDTLVFAVESGSFPGQYRELVEFDVGERLTMRWRSGLLTAPGSTNWGVAQVFADQYPVTFVLLFADPDTIPQAPAGQPALDQDDLLGYVVEVQGPEPFRLPSVYLSREFVIQVEGKARVQEVTLGHVMMDLLAS